MIFPPIGGRVQPGFDQAYSDDGVCRKQRQAMAGPSQNGHASLAPIV
jgi:hypothetical protein